MLAALFALALPSAVLAVHTEEKRGLTDGEAHTLLLAFEETIRHRLPEMRVEDVDGKKLDCPFEQRCPDRIRQLTSADEIAFVRMIGIPTTIRFIVDIVGSDGRARTATADIDRPPDGAALDSVVTKLFPQPAAPVPTETPVAEASPPKVAPPKDPPLVVSQPAAESPRILPWAVIGTSAAMLLTGIVFGVENRSARNDGMNTDDPARIDSLKTKTLYTGLIADIAFVLTAVGAVVGVVLLASDGS